MSGKYALVIGSSEYNDPKLPKLTTPIRDTQEFARILGDKDICAFDEVRVALNEPSAAVREMIDGFFAERKPDDLLVLYFSGHGVKDDDGALYLAFKNTDHSRLFSTAIEADYIRKAMDHSRSKRQAIILDCCNSGAFPQGGKGELGGSMGMISALQGYGRFVLTASDAMQYAWEGGQVVDGMQNSIFTHYLVKGLEGDADTDGNGKITVDELYDYVYDQISHTPAKQTPTKSAAKVEGELVLRQITRMEDIKPVALPADLMEEVQDVRPYVRQAAVEKLATILKGQNIGMARSAVSTLEQIAADQNTTRLVAGLATAALESYRGAASQPQAATAAPALPPQERRATPPATRATQPVVERRAAEQRVPAAPATESKAPAKRSMQVAVGAVGVVVLLVVSYFVIRALLPSPASPTGPTQAPASQSAATLPGVGPGVTAEATTAVPPTVASPNAGVQPGGPCGRLANAPAAPAAGALGSPDNAIVIAFVPLGDLVKVTKAGDSLAACLNQITGLSFRTYIGNTPTATVEALGSEKAQVGFLNTFSALLAKQKYGVFPAMFTLRTYNSNDIDPDKALAGQLEPFYRSQFIANTASGIQSLQDLKGKKFCFVNPSSTSGYIIPRIVLKANGVDPDRDFSATVNTNSHNDVATAVYQGDCDAGVTYINVLSDPSANLAAKFPDILQKVKPFVVTERFPNDGIQFINSLDPKLQAAIVEGLLAMSSNPSGQYTLKGLYNYTTLQKVDPNAYDAWLTLLQEAGVDPATLVK